MQGSPSMHPNLAYILSQLEIAKFKPQALNPKPETQCPKALKTTP